VRAASSAATGAFSGAARAGSVVFASGEARHLRELRAPIVALRALVESFVAFTFISALGALPLADITAILQTTPIVLTVLAVVLGLETVGWRRWGAILAGFFGVLLIVKPGWTGFNVYAGLALLSAFLVAVRDLMTRRIAGHIPTVVVTLATTVLEGEPDDILDMPTESLVPLALAAAIAIVFAGFLDELWLVAGVGGALILVALAWWHKPERRLQEQ